ncbi:unnamed protein product [Miscanthus lutarioriparius]|uniref:Uncharacterized protein n=1 Tax=Miscanthus lutarioriparius TaxID=422564 RepID=A0A811QMR5_9POAL|nr:unnamed protein product [Miscanthus lutarioriparius]
MAVLKIQSIVAVSEDLQITHLPLLHWKAKLKRVAVEGDSLLHVHKKKTLERSTTAEKKPSTLQRFERLADGADSFFRLVVESSGRHLERSVPSSPSLTQSLLAGNSVEFCLQRPGTGSSDLVLLWPWLDPDAEDELQAYLMVAREDEVTWQRNLKMVISFRLSEAANILAIAMGCLDLLPPQFGAAWLAIMGLLHQTLASSQSDRWRSNLSAKSMWCRRMMRDGLPPPVIRVTTFCYALPKAMDNNNGFPLKLACHVSPYLLPEKHSSQFMQVEQNVILETMLPKVEEGFYDDQRQAPVKCKREIWCPQSAMYCSVAPEITQPMTMSKAYLMENSTAPINRKKRRRKSHAMSK